MLDNRKASLFFSLPLELREEIYKSVLSSPNEGSDILRTCHEIWNEAHKFMFQRPLIFRGQEALYTWLDKTPRELLAYVSEITVHVQDVDLKPLLISTMLNYQASSTSTLQTSGLYRTEVGRFEQALKELPRIKTITLRALSNQSSFLYRHFVTEILKVLGRSCPDLVDLRLVGNFQHEDLQFLTALRSLESFSFDGFSSSSSATAIKVLPSLKHLRNLSLVLDRVPLGPHSGLHSSHMVKCKSFIGDVIRNMVQLESFSISQQVQASPPTFCFTSEILNSIQDHKTLRSLSIQFSRSPDTATLTSLEELLERTVIEHLELDWPGLQFRTLEHYRLLGGNLQILWARAERETDAVDILWLILQIRRAGNLPNLRKVVLVRSTRCYGAFPSETCNKGDGSTEPVVLEAHNNGNSVVEDQEELSIVRANGILRGIGIHVAWYTEN